MQSKYAANSGIYIHIHIARVGTNWPRSERKKDRRSAARRIQNRYPRIRYTHEWLYLSRYRSYARASFSRFLKIPTTSTRHSPLRYGELFKLAPGPISINVVPPILRPSKILFYISGRRRRREKKKRAGQTSRACPIIRAMYSLVNEIGSDSMIM